MEIKKGFWECLKYDEFKQSSIFDTKIILVIGYDFIDNIIEINIDQHSLRIYPGLKKHYFYTHNIVLCTAELLIFFVILRTTVCLDI
jgi:hypothetical protein